MDSLQAWSKTKQEFQNEQMLKVLYAPLPSSELPEQRTKRMTKIKTWEALVKESCQVLNRVTFTLEELKVRFKECSVSKLVVPLCLEDVLDDMIRTKQVQSVKDFTAPEQSWGSWAMSALLSLSFGSSIEHDGRFVLLDRIKEVAAKITQKFKLHENHVLLMDDLKDQIKQEVQEADTDSVIAMLLNNKQATLVKTKDGQHEGIKFSNEITEADVGVLQLKVAMLRLEQQKKNIESKIDQCTAAAKKVLQHKNQALIFIRQRRRLTDLLTQRLTYMDTLSQVLEKIEATHTNKEMLDAFRAGTKAIQETTQRYGLTAQVVDDALSDLSEVLTNQQEIDQAFVTGTSSLPGMPDDDDELQAELDKLMVSEEAHQMDALATQLTALKVASDPLQTSVSEPQSKQQVLV